MTDIEDILERVADELSWLEPQPVFLGGATIGLYLDPFGRAQMRPTIDIDCIAPSVVSRVAWYKLEKQLRDRGWSPVPEGPICRYRSPGGAIVDIMTEDPEILGFAGRWYSATVTHAEWRDLPTGRRIKVPTPEHLLACKLEAWRDRGRRDPLVSADLEDVVALLDGCTELEERVVGAPPTLRAWISEALAEILGTEAYRSAAAGHLPRGGDEPAREARLYALMERLVD